MEKLYTEEIVQVKEYKYDFDKIKDIINDYLKDNVLEEQWGDETYSRKVTCTGVSLGGFTGKNIELELIYTDQGYDLENSYIDEDLPFCGKFDSFKCTLSKQLPEGVRIVTPSYYYAK